MSANNGKATPPKRFGMLPLSILEDRRLSGCAIRILTTLAYYGRRTGRCFPGRSTIAEKAGVDRRTVQRILPKLVALGLVRVDPTKANPTGREFILLWIQAEGQGTDAPPRGHRGAPGP